MLIHAVYENGIFRPIDPVPLPENCEVSLVVQGAQQGEPRDGAARPLASIAAIAGQYAENPMHPIDQAAQHDHYLYGTPKR